MTNVTISEEAYNEFRAFLQDNEIEDFSIRINFAGNSCSGPAFNISVDGPKEGDVVEKVNDISFVMEKDLIDEFGGFILLSTEENDGRGLSLRPVFESEGGCSSCPGCH
ncbi:MAG: HesB-like protein [Bacillota bacterium]|nr:HesB-like protein [Bacillota bacterium]